MTNPESTDTLVIEQITMSELYALAQFTKRLMFSDFESKSTSEDEAYKISDAVAKLQRALSDAGYAPR